MQKASAKQANSRRKQRTGTRGESGFTFVYVTHSLCIHSSSVRASSTAVAPEACWGLLAERKQRRHGEGVSTRVATDASLANSHSPRCARSKRARGTHEASVSRLMCSVTVFLLRPACLAACLRPCCQRQSTSHMPHAPPQVNNNNNKNMATARATAPLAAAMIFEINST